MRFKLDSFASEASQVCQCMKASATSEASESCRRRLRIASQYIFCKFSWGIQFSLSSIPFVTASINLSGEEPELEDEDGIRKSALDLDPEAQAVMEMMGKTFVSKDVRAADEQDEKTKKELPEN